MSGFGFGANAAVMQDGQVLLQQREDFEVWALPGGHVDPGESLAATAAREAREETGLQVRVTGLVGLYARLGGEVDMQTACFRAAPVGGSPRPQAGEVLAVRWWPVDALPQDMLWWHRQQVADAAAGVTGAAWHFRLRLAEAVTSRHELYALRDRSGMSRVEFYRYIYESAGIEAHCDLPGTRPD